MRLFVTAAVAVAVALCATPLAMTAARRLGIVDSPGPLKPQQAPVPYLGGVAVFGGVLVGLCFGRLLLGVPLAMAMVLGVVDDARGLSPWVRLVGEIAIGAAVAAMVTVHVPHHLGPVLVVLATVLLVNGMNFIDGLDGLAAGVAAAAAVGFAVLVHGPDRYLAVALAGALAGFLVFNRAPARVYLGDSGAYLLGTAVAVMLALGWASGVRPSVSRAVLLLVVIPPAEIVFAVVRRIRGRQSVLAGDRGHPYDRLVEHGWAPARASLVYIAAEGLLVCAAVVLSRVRPVVPATAGVAVVALGCVGIAGSLGALKPDSRAGPTAGPTGAEGGATSTQ